MHNPFFAGFFSLWNVSGGCLGGIKVPSEHEKQREERWDPHVC